MLKFYLSLNAFLYLLFAVMCVINPTGTGNTLGYDFLNNSGKVEYLTLYTGLELSFTFFLALCAFYPRLSFAGLVFSVCIYVGIMLTRTICSLYYGNVLKVTYLVGALEYLLGIWGIILLTIELKKIN